MASHAAAYNSGRVERRVRFTQKNPRPVAQRPWNEVSLAIGPVGSAGKSKTSSSVWWLAAAVVAAHLSVIWYARHHIPVEQAKPLKRELAVEIVRPPKPIPPPKVEPPKPIPQQRLQRPVQVVPPVQSAAAEPTDAAGETGETVAVAPVATAPPAPEPVTAALGYAGYLNNPPPDYPSLAVRKGWEGTVLLRVRVLSNGHVESIQIEDSSGRQILDLEAVKTVKNWLFTPSKQGDTPIDGWATVPIEFKLDS